MLLAVMVSMLAAVLFVSVMLFFDLSPLEAAWIALASLLVLVGAAFLNRKRSYVGRVIFPVSDIPMPGGSSSGQTESFASAGTTDEDPE